jgi:hypothetical protein
VPLARHLPGVGLQRQKKRKFSSEYPWLTLYSNKLAGGC